MFRPSASSTYSSAMSMMRTQALPNCCAISGTMSSAAAAKRKPTTRLSLKLIMVVASSSRPVGHALAEQALRPEGEHEDQHDEREDVLVMAAQHAAGDHADVAGAQRFDEPEQHAAHHRTRQVADAPEHRRGEGLEAGEEAHGVLHRPVVGRVH